MKIGKLIVTIALLLAALTLIVLWFSFADPARLIAGNPIVIMGVDVRTICVLGVFVIAIVIGTIWTPARRHR